MDNSESLLHRILELNLLFDNLEKDGGEGCCMRKATSSSEKFRIKGNKLYNQNKHDRKDHIQLISLYTASICFAPKDSDDLPKGLSNRSAVLMHLRHYEKALIDIDRALLVTKSDDLKSRLESRRERCLRFMNKHESNVIISNELPNMQPSSHIPNASEAVEIKYSESLGRHLVATRDVKAGEMIIAEEAYTCFPEQDRIHFVCSHCLRFAWNGIPCDTCVLVIFCSEECKNEAWLEYHDVECSIIRTMCLITQEDSITKAMVTVRSFIKAIKTEGFVNVINEIKASDEQNDDLKKLLCNGVLDSKKFRSYCNLLFETDNKKSEDDKRSDFNSALLTVTLLYRHTNIIPVSKLEDFNAADNELLMTSIKVITRLNDILHCNIFVSQAPFCDCIDTNKCKESCDLDRGILLAATCSLINHNCCPNVCRMFLPGKKVVMYTVTPVKKGHQFWDSYGPVFTQKKEERQKTLKERYNFLCTCPACEEDWPQNIEIELCKNPITIAPMFDKLMKDCNNYFPDQKLSYKKISTEFIDHWLPEKSMLEKVTILAGLIYKYFDYRSAYYHCLIFNLYIDMAFSKLYGENCIIPNTC